MIYVHSMDGALRNYSERPALSQKDPEVVPAVIRSPPAIPTTLVRCVQKTSLIQLISNPVELVCTLPFVSVEDTCDGGCDEGARFLG